MLSSKNSAIIDESAESDDLLIQAPPSFQTLLALNPQALVTKLCDDIIFLIKNYEFSHPAGQSRTTDSVIKEILFYANKEQIEDGLFATFDLKQENYYRRTYLDLCGLLYHAHHKVTHGLLDYDDNILAMQLEKLCQSIYVKDEGNLPGPWEINGTDCKRLFMQLKKNRRFTSTSLESDYQAARKTLQGRLANYVYHTVYPDNTIYHAPIGRILEILDNERNNSNFDLKFAVYVLRSTYDLIEHGADANVIENYCRLATFAPGIPNLGKKLQGIMLALAACCLITFGVLCGVQSAGLATPFASYLIYTGMHSLELTTCLLTVAGGTYGLYKSVGIFKQGLSSGLSQEMMELANCREKNINLPQPC